MKVFRISFRNLGEGTKLHEKYQNVYGLRLLPPQAGGSGDSISTFFLIFGPKESRLNFIRELLSNNNPGVKSIDWVTEDSNQDESDLLKILTEKNSNSVLYTLSEKGWNVLAHTPRYSKFEKNGEKFVFNDHWYVYSKESEMEFENIKDLLLERELMSGDIINIKEFNSLSNAFWDLNLFPATKDIEIDQLKERFESPLDAIQYLALTYTDAMKVYESF